MHHNGLLQLFKTQFNMSGYDNCELLKMIVNEFIASELLAQIMLRKFRRFRN